MPVSMLPLAGPDPQRLAELAEEIALEDLTENPRVSWVEFAILRVYHQHYRLTPKPKGWRRIDRLARAIRRKYGR